MEGSLVAKASALQAGDRGFESHSSNQNNCPLV